MIFFIKNYKEENVLRKDLTSLEVIHVAIKSEIDSALLYREMAAKITNPIVKLKIQNLAKDEKNHQEILTALFKRLSGAKRVPVIKGEKSSALKEFGAKNIRELLILAINLEEETAELYSKAAKESKDPSGTFILNYLADFEKGHQKTLEIELKAMDTNENWLSENILTQAGF